jgi:REP element-mobilizing transposase RayT
MKTARLGSQHAALAAQACLQGGLHHVLSRGHHRQVLFHGPGEFAQFIELMAEGQRRHGIKLWGYCLMGNHWHVVAEVSQVEMPSKWVHWPCNRHVRLFHRKKDRYIFGLNLASLIVPVPPFSEVFTITVTYNSQITSYNYACSATPQN